MCRVVQAILIGCIVLTQIGCKAAAGKSGPAPSTDVDEQTQGAAEQVVPMYAQSSEDEYGEDDTWSSESSDDGEYEEDSESDESDSSEEPEEESTEEPSYEDYDDSESGDESGDEYESESW